MRKILLTIIGLVTIAYVAFSLAELESIAGALRQSRPLYLGVGMVVVAALLVNNTAAFWVLYRLEGLNENSRSLFLLVTAATFINLVTPASGIGGLAVFLSEARRRKQATGRVLVAGILFVLYDYAALFIVLAAGFLVLQKLGKLNAVELVAAGILLVIAVGIGAGLAVGYRSTRQLGDLLAWLARSINRLAHLIRRRDVITVDSVYSFSSELSDGLTVLHEASLGKKLFPLVFTLTNKSLLMLSLWIAFLAFGAKVSGETLITGFSIGQLFVYASPTPSGIGVVEGILPFAFRSLDVPLTQAVLVSLVYRAFTLWVPLILGSFTFRSLQRARA